MDSTIAGVQSAMSDASAMNFTAIATNLSNAVTAWTNAYNQAGDLNVNLQETIPNMPPP